MLRKEWCTLLKMASWFETFLFRIDCVAIFFKQISRTRVGRIA
jgi:hypothetical protein